MSMFSDKIKSECITSKYFVEVKKKEISSVCITSKYFVEVKKKKYPLFAIEMGIIQF